MSKKKKIKVTLPSGTRRSLKDKWQSNLVLLNTDGKVVQKVPGEEDAVKLFQNIAKDEFFWLIDDNINRLQKSGQFNGMLPTEEVEKIAADVEKKLAYYMLLKPQTYCFTPYPNESLDDDILIELIQPLLDLDRYQKVRGKPLLKYHHPDSDMPLTLYNRLDRLHRRHSTHICAYLSTEKQSMRIKLYSIHKGTDRHSRDKLDVEAQFHKGRFQGIAHYHVETEFTSGLIYDYLRAVEKKNEHHDHLGQLAPLYQAHPSNLELRIHLDNSPATVTVQQPVEQEANMGELKKKYRIIREWHRHPELVGGELFYDIVEFVRSNKKFRKLQHMAVQKYKSN